MASCDVLLTYAWVRSSYAALRSLSKLGLKVAVADVGSVGMGQWSRYAHFAGQYSPPLTQPKQFVSDIAHLLRDTQAPFLLPGHDETEILAKYRDQLPKDVLLPIAEYTKIHHANDKAWTTQFAIEHDIPVPTTVQWRDLNELEQRLSVPMGPFVVKLRRGNSAKGVFYPNSKNEVISLCSTLIEQYELQPERYPVVQERISGDGWGVSCLYWQGERIASFTHRRLREKTATGGTSTLRESARHPELEKYAHKLLDKLAWHGLAMVEFKYDAASRRGWFIEINPRLWGSIHLAIAAGIDFPAYLYIAATQGADKAHQTVGQQITGIAARWYLGDLILAISAIGHLRVAQSLRLMWPGGTESLDDWHLDDPSAFFGEAAYYLTNAIRYRSLNPVQQGMLG